MYKNRALKILWLFVTLLTTVLNTKTQSWCVVTVGACALVVLGAREDGLFCFIFQLNDVGQAEQDKLEY